MCGLTASKQTANSEGKYYVFFPLGTFSKNTQQTFKLKYSEKIKTLLCVQTNLSSTAGLPIFITLKQVIIQYTVHKKHSGTGQPGSNPGSTTRVTL